MRIHALLFFFLTQSALGFDLYGAKPAANKHLVKLAVSGEVFCQGVVIAPTKVLTSGHCIVETSFHLDKNPYSLTYHPEVVTVIAEKNGIQAKVITVAQTYFDSPGVSAEDLALVELSRPLKDVEILPVANSRDVTVGADVLLTAGKQEAASKVLQRLRGLGGLIIKADGSKSGICQGDSGGALILVKSGKKYLAGILSAQSQGCARKHVLSYFPKHSLE